MWVPPNPVSLVVEYSVAMLLTQGFNPGRMNQVNRFSSSAVALVASHRVDKCALLFLKLPHSEAKEKVICGASVVELFETIGNSGSHWCSITQVPSISLIW